MTKAVIFKKLAAFSDFSAEGRDQMTEAAYSGIRQYRDQQIIKVSHNHVLVNHLHDEIMIKVIQTAMKQIAEELGSPPAPFSFFVTGSAGRFEQAIWSDQDHGIIFADDSEAAQTYFLALGKEIVKGLYLAGYPYCSGGVMASSPVWCKSTAGWTAQLTKWIQESSWESIRNLLIFVDCRNLFGEMEYTNHLKVLVYEAIHREKLIERIFSNTSHLQNGIGILGQFLVETHGVHAGTLNIKEKMLFPFVNAARLLAVKEKMLASSTLTRLGNISEKSFSAHDKKLYQDQFNKLLHFRLIFGNHSNYESGHYLSIGKMPKMLRKELKEIIQAGIKLNHHARTLVEKED